MCLLEIFVVLMNLILLLSEYGFFLMDVWFMVKEGFLLLV